MEAAIRNRVFDVLDDGPKTLSQVSAETGASKRGLRAIMNALVGLELLSKSKGEEYALTPESAAFLVSTRPGYMGGLVRHTSEHLLPKWLHLTEVVRTGAPRAAVNQQTTGAEFFHEFVEDIFPMSWPAACALAQHLNLPNASQPVSVLDIATGSGVWGIAMAKESPMVRVRAVDWEHVLDVTRRVTTRFGVADRFEYIDGDILAADLGSGHHVATLGHILHSEGEERARKLLGRVYDALAPGAHVAIAEMVPNDERTAPAFPLIFAVNMLVHTDAGDTFPFEEMKAWLAETGFANARTFESPGPSPLLLATKPK
jgi:precorrin-6B methylase 2